MDVSISSIFKLAKLEEIFQSFQRRLDAQETQIHSLQRTIQDDYIPLAQHNTHISTLTEQITALSSRIKAVELVSDTVTTHVSALDSHATILHSHSAQMEQCVSDEQFDNTINELRQTFTDQMSRLAAETAPLRLVSAVESSQHSLLTHLKSIDSSLSLKIDRAEFPLLQEAHERITAIINTLTRVDNIETRVNEVVDVLAQKEDSERMVMRMHTINEALSERPTIASLKSNVYEPLHALRDDVVHIKSLSHQMERALHESSHMNASMMDVTDRMKQVTTLVNHLKSEHDRIGETISLRISAVKLETKKSCDRQIREYHQQNIHDFKVHAAIIADIREQIVELNEHYIQQTEKLNVALKFIDWFTESKLHHT